MRGDVALVEGVAAALGDQPVGAGEVGIAEDLAGAGAVARGVGRLRVGDLLDAAPGAGEVRHRPVHVVGDDGRERHAAFGIGDRRLEQFGPAQLAVALVQLPPGVDRARHGHRDRAVGGQDAVCGRASGRCRGRGRAGCGPSRRCRRRAPRRVPQHREAVAADAVGGRLEEAERGVDRDRRVDRRAALLQYLDAGQGAERMRGGRGAVAAEHRRAGGEAGADRAVAGVDVGVDIGWRGGTG